MVRQGEVQAAERSSSTRLTTASESTIAQALQFNLKQIGIELDLKYYDCSTKFEKLGTRGEPFDISYINWGVDWADPAAFFEPLLDPDLRATGNMNFSYFVAPVGEPAGWRRRVA